MRLLTIKEVAKELKTNVHTVYKLKEDGKLKFLKLGSWKCRPQELERFLEEEERLQNAQ